MHAPIQAMVAITSGTTLFRFIEDTVSLLEVLAVAVILVSVLLAIVAGIRTLGSGAWAASAEAKRTIANGVLLGLELLIAADVIQTVTLERTLSNAVAPGDPRRDPDVPVLVAVRGDQRTVALAVRADAALGRRLKPPEAA